jgi:hypothetical protein
MKAARWLVALLAAGSSGLRVLVVHPLYAGSHVLTLQAVTEELLARGHAVTTVKFRDTSLPPLRTAGHANFTLVRPPDPLPLILLTAGRAQHQQ